MKDLSKGKWTIGILAAFLLTAGASATTAKADVLLNSYNYRLTAQVDYETGFEAISRGPQYVGHVRIAVYGQYCNLVSAGLEYLQTSPGVAYLGQPDGQGGFYVNANVVALNYHFEQSVYRNADCRVELWSTDGSGGGDTGNPTVLVQQARSLSTEANLLSITLKLTAGYESLRPQASDLANYAKYFYDSASAGQSRDRLTAIFKIIRDKSSAFESQFIPVQVANQNSEVQTAWLEFTKALDTIRL